MQLNNHEIHVKNLNVQGFLQQQEYEVFFFFLQLKSFHLLHCKRKSICCRSVTRLNATEIAFGNYSHLLVYYVQKSYGLETVRLSALKVKQTAKITQVNRLVNDNDEPDLVAIRLESLGFVPGAQVQVITKGVFGGDPILIQIGFTRFALRKSEADKIEIQLEGAPT